MSYATDFLALMCGFLVVAGAIFIAFSVATYAVVRVCKLMKWMPIHIEIKLNNNFGGEREE